VTKKLFTNKIVIPREGEIALCLLKNLPPLFPVPRNYIIAQSIRSPIDCRTIHTTNPKESHYIDCNINIEIGISMNTNMISNRTIAKNVIATTVIVKPICPPIGG
jgi:hypothetical protein